MAFSAGTDRFSGLKTEANNTPSAAERVLAAELANRGDNHEALSMMVSSMVRMVQAGQTRESRWKDC